MVSALYRSREREKFSVMFRNTLTDKGYYDIDIAILNKSVHISFACDTIPDTNCLFYHSPFEGEYPANIKDILIRNKEKRITICFADKILENMELYSSGEKLIDFIVNEKEKFYINLENTGNTTSTTIPLALEDCLDKGLFKNGDKVLIAGFGVGLSWAGTVLSFE